MNKDSVPDFSGKTISMSIIDDSNSHDLHDPKFEYQGGRLFIVGTIPVMATESGWTGNKVGGIAWERVVEYCLFPDLEAYEKAVKLSELTKENEKDK